MSDQIKSSIVSGFYKLPVKKRVEFVKEFSDLNYDETKLFSACLDMGIADRIVVISEGRKIGIVDRSDYDEEELLRMASGELETAF